MMNRAGFDIEIPESMNDHIHGAEGAAWRERLPQILDDCRQQWGLTPQPPLTADHVWMKVNYIAPALRGDEPVILKLMQGRRTFERERESLLLCGETAGRLLASDDERLVLMLEHVQPGLPLATVTDDDESTRIAAGLIKRYWQPAPETHGLGTVADRMRGFDDLRARFDGATGPIPHEWVRRAEEAWSHLRATSPEPAVLHGDFHHWNVLQATREPWLAIDPQGLVGDPGYDLPSFVTNRSTVGEPPRAKGEVYDRRATILAQELGMSRERILTWCWVHAVLYCWISFKDGDAWEGHIDRAALLKGLI